MERLRVLATGQEFRLLNVHKPADTARFHHQARCRAEATAHEIRLVASLSRSPGVPILVTGDMNETALAFCRFTETGLLTAAAGGTQTDMLAVARGRLRPASTVLPEPAGPRLEQQAYEAALTHRAVCRARPAP